jgi:hypothetical protein
VGVRERKEGREKAERRKREGREKEERRRREGKWNRFRWLCCTVRTVSTRVQGVQ